MFQEWIRQANAQQQEMMKPMARINEVLVSNMEKLTSHQINAMGHYAEQQYSFMKKLNEASAKGDMAELGQAQMSQLAELNRRFLQDCKAMMALSESFRKDFNGIFVELAKQEEKA
ncbi:phasin family protein [Gallaecimonas sp. GXIMD4217]|uniref:phasin family protein n=1 Tax=Gallaecimonas sp. GXIMD4217 TaxID=3131927 RepID=UPI00311ADB18